MIQRLLLTGFIILMLMPVSTWASERGTVDAVYLPVGTLTLAAPRGVAARRTPVAFPHSRHFGYTCGTCHHTWDGHSTVKGCAASGCHDQTISVKGAKSEIPSIRYYKEAYHKSCIGCHRRLMQQRHQIERSRSVVNQSLPRTGPTSCIQCHPKN